MHPPEKEPLDLAALQRWMQAVIMHPGGARQGVLCDEAQREIAVSGQALDSVVNPSNAMTSLARMEIYAGAYYARLLECLRAEYPITAKALGEELFDEFAVGYLGRYPSTSYTLCRLGAKFSQYLAETRPDEPDGWPDVLIELARLEWTFGEVFDGPGSERQSPLSAEALAQIPADRLSRVRLVAAPCLRLLELQYPVQRYYHALRAGEDAVPPDRERTLLAISRRDFVVQHYELSEFEYELLAAILASVPLGDAIERAAAALPAHTGLRDMDSLSAQVQAAFARWSAEGFFLSAEIAQPG